MPLKPLPQTSYLSVGPGRVNLLGEHVDYNDGFVLPAAIDRAVHLAANPLAGRVVHLHALDLDQSASFNLDALGEKLDVNGQALPSWAIYPAGVADVLIKHGLSVQAIEGWFTSDIPMGSGLSSSAAVEVAFASLWQELGGWNMDRVSLARLCQEAENRYVGVNCGLMDQFASANGVEGHALYFDTRNLDFQAVPLPTGSAIIIADSGVRRKLTNSAYNDRRASCEEAVRLLKTRLPGIRALRDVSPEQFAEHGSILPAEVHQRAQHIVEECARVAEAIVLLKAGDAANFGRLMYAGHASLRDLYEVSCPELDTLVAIASTLPGCWGARLTGAGFGGCTVNLVDESHAPAFIEGLKKGYEKSTGRQAEVYLCHASRGGWAQKRA